LGSITSKKTDLSDSLINDFTVVAAIRNEKENLDKLLTLAKLTNFNNDVILVNDLSEDLTQTELENYFKEYSHVTVLKNNGLGKKAALKTALKEVSTKWILVTDADCFFNKEWLISISFVEPKQSELIILPVNQTSNSFIESFSWWESSAMQVIGLKAASNFNPVFASGANLLVTKNLLSKVDYSLNKSSSGDDIFLLKYALANQFKVSYWFNKDVTLHTKAPNNLADLVNQRLRWGKKVFSYSNFLDKLPAIFWFLVQLSFIYIVVKVFFLDTYAWMWFIVLKLLTESFFFYKLKKYFDGPSLGFNFLFSWFFYPFFSVYLVILALIKNPTWKGRKVH